MSQRALLYIIATALLSAAGMSACAAAASRGSSTSASGPGGGTALTPAEQAQADSGRMPYTRADVAFMQGMIAHHAQAVVMASWAPTHGASDAVQRLAARIDVAQRDEIAFMQRWLRDRHEMVPDPAALHAVASRKTAGHDMDMPGMSMPLMPGMLTPEQMAQLDSARGTDFDRLFLTFMIQHHRGAITMVDHLFATPGGGQELYVFRFASDVNADQTTEIERMQRMLDALSSGARGT